MMHLISSPGGTAITEDRIPILFLDINFGNDEISRIVLFEGDLPKTIVEKFAMIHGKYL